MSGNSELPVLNKVSALSFGQEQLWMIDHLQPGNFSYNVPVGFYLNGDLNVKKLETGLNKIIERHEILRTSFGTSQDQPVQIVHPKLEIKITVVDLSESPLNKQKILLQELASKETSTPFDLSKLPLLRVTIYKLEEQTHVLLINIHHIIADGYSVGLICQELSKLYKDEYSLLPEVPIQYIDYTIIEKNRVSENLQKQLDYWKTKLSGELPVLELPFDKQRLPVQSPAGSNEFFVLPKTTINSLQLIGRQERSTFFMVVLTSLYLLLYRYSRQEDIIIGVPVTSRFSTELQNLVGYFLNMTPLRANISGEITFVGLLKIVRQIVLESFSNQNIPFEKIVENLNINHDLSRNPVFQVILDVSPMISFTLGNLKIERFHFDKKYAQFDLSVHLTEDKDGFVGRFEYDTDLFESSTIRRMIDHFQILLEEIIKNPEKKISDYSFITSEEKEILDQINVCGFKDTEKFCLHKLFEKQADTSPNAVALEYENNTLTYKILDEQSNQLANFLIKKGIKPEIPVAISMERSLELIVGLLGILKAGGAYVPIDPAYPKERINFMLTDSGAPILLTQKHLKNESYDFKGLIIYFEDYLGLIESESKLSPNIVVEPENMAYIIYTSGSTGVPKGAINTHKGIVNYISRLQEYYKLSQEDIALQKTPISFDVSVREIFLPLTTGARLVLAKHNSHKDSSYLIDLIVSKKITFLSFVPSQLNLFLSEKNVTECQSIRQVVCSGEALSISLQKLFFEKLNAELDNLYGPTEAAVDVTRWQCLKDQNMNSVPIGKPIPNNKIYILDDYNKIVPIGIPGEICIGGIQLARGYLNRENLTTEKFIPDPLSPEPDGRIYKTGDLGRILNDGTIEYIGRKDNQVKIRGFRIELGEIEAILESIEAVQSTLVIGKEFGTGDIRLIAYLIPAENQILDENNIKNILAEKLPDYMIPSYFVVIDKFPLTPNGKIDRKKLPDPEISLFHRKSEFSTATNHTEYKLIELWKQILKINSISIDYNFFDLGGNSLLATRLVISIENTFNKKLSLLEIFKTPTVRQIAEKLQQTENKAIDLIPLKKVERPNKIPLSFAQQRLWFLDQLEPSNPVYNIPLAFKIEGKIEIAILQKAINSIISRHEVLRTRFIIEDGIPYQDIVEHLELQIQLIDLSGEDEQSKNDRVHTKLKSDARHIFDLSMGPLIVAKIYKLSSFEHVLFILMHHTVSDGWSNTVFVKELNQFYSSSINNSDPNLSKLSVQYADYSVWQRDWLKNENYDRQLDYWKKQLNGELPTLSIYTDYPRPPIQSYSGNLIQFDIEKELFGDLSLLGMKENVSVFMIILAALNALIYRYSGQTDISVGSPIANRIRSELYEMIGFFANTIIYRNQFSDNSTFTELLQSVRETCLAAYENQDIPFEKLVEELKPDRDISRTPLFQIMLAYQEDKEEYELSSGLSLKPVYVDSGTSRTDITLHVFNSGTKLNCALEYSDKLYKPDTMKRFINNFINLLKQISKNPVQNISNVPAIETSELNRILYEWNDNKMIYPQGFTIIGLFENQVNKAPDGIALEYDGKEYTYSEINSRANKLAHYLKESGVVPEVTVGIFMNRNVDMIVGILAVLKAGGAYVPLDPNYPINRIKYILADSKAEILISNSNLEETLTDIKVQKLISIEKEREKIDGLEDSNPGSTANENNLAYIIYTSGSTGTPKGVAIEHRSAVALIMWAGNVFKKDELKGVLASTSICFDLSIFEMFVTLSYGGKVVLVENALHLSYLRPGSNLTLINSVPSIISQLIQQTTIPETVKVINLAGEPLKQELVEKIYRSTSVEKVYDLYGPSEDTTYSTYTLRTPGGYETIGKPINNTQLYILDKNLQPLPQGAPGEIHLGGSGLARGYYEKKDLTKEKFIDNPFSKGSRLYKTGDFGRFLENGDVQYLGRLDNQVKIRGFRIELGEIEKRLTKHPSVKEAVVIVKEIRENDKQLIAYTIPSDSNVGYEELKSFLKAELPDYMIPSFIVKLEKFPLTPNAKIDRKSLPDPADIKTVTGDNFVEPGDELELKLAAIWKKLLGIKKISIKDDFFKLGGHSLLAAQLFALIEKTLGKNLPLATLFKAPTIEQIANILRQENWKPEWSSVVPIKTTGTKPPIFLVHGAEGNVLLYKNLAYHLNEDQPVYGIQSGGLDGSDNIQPDIQIMAGNYIREIKTIQPEGPYNLGGYCLGGTIAFEIAQQLTASGDEVSLLAMFECYNVKNISFPLPIYKKWIHTLQNWGYQIGNILMSGADGGMTYFNQKLSVEGSRFKVKFSIALSRVLNIIKDNNHLTYTHIKVEKINHEAQANYEPKPYNGKITLFNPKNYYLGLDNKSYGWKSLAKGGINIINLPVYPKGQLNEPFVKFLAEKLTVSLENKQ